MIPLEASSKNRLWDPLAHEAQFLHQWGPYESYGGIRTTIRRRISIRIFLDRSQVQLKPLLHHQSRKSESRLLILGSEPRRFGRIFTKMQFYSQIRLRICLSRFRGGETKESDTPGLWKGRQRRVMGTPPRFFLSIEQREYIGIFWFPNWGCLFNSRCPALRRPLF